MADKRWWRNRRRWLLSTVLALVASGVGFVLVWERPGREGDAHVQAAADSRAPTFTLPSTTDAPVALEAHLGQHPVVLVFYRGDF